MASRPPRKLVTTMRLPPDLMEAVKRAAAREGRSQANLVENILRSALKRRPRQVTPEPAHVDVFD